MISVIVQAGGESSRMGQNKALVPFLGDLLIRRVLRRVSMLGDEVIITSNQTAGFESLPTPLVADVYSGVGALCGLYTALCAAFFPVVVVVACDMPFVNAALLKKQIKILLEEGVDAVVPRSEGGFEPFHAVYQRDPCLKAVKAALEDGQKRMISWFPAVRVREVTLAEIRDSDPLGRSFYNVNTPSEVQQAEAIAIEEQSDG